MWAYPQYSLWFGERDLREYSCTICLFNFPAHLRGQNYKSQQGVWESKTLYGQGACGFLKAGKYCDREKWDHSACAFTEKLCVGREVQKAKKFNHSNV